MNLRQIAIAAADLKPGQQMSYLVTEDDPPLTSYILRGLVMDILQRNPDLAPLRVLLEGGRRITVISDAINT